MESCKQATKLEEEGREGRKDGGKGRRKEKKEGNTGYSTQEVSVPLEARTFLVTHFSSERNK